MSDIQNKILEWFKDIHKCPELGNEEFETTKLIRRVLTEHGVEMLPWYLDTGALAVVRGAKPGPTIAVRADIDALQIQEASGVPYSSENAGVMHACGHDFHTAMVLGTAVMLQERREELCGTVKFVFQPDEEHAAGARVVEDTGVLSDVELMIAGHTYPQETAGWLGIKEGPVMAAVDRFSVTLKGISAHAAAPHMSKDPVPAICELALALQTIVSRNIEPFTPALLTIAHVESGNTWNVIPDSALLEGTVRTMDAASRQLIRDNFARITNGIAAAYGLEAQIDWITGPPAVVNDKDLCEIARNVAAQQGFRYGKQIDTMGGEDFSLLAEGKPRLFVRVGTGGPRPQHHSGFIADPDALLPAAKFFTELVLSVQAR